MKWKLKMKLERGEMERGRPSAPGPGQYEIVDPGVTKMPNTPGTPWGNRGVWADVDHVELTKQKRDNYGRYMTAEGRRTLAEMSMSRAQSRAMSRGALQSRASAAPFGVSRGASPARPSIPVCTGYSMNKQSHRQRLTRM